MFHRKVKILRVITQAEVVPWHLKNFIDRSENDYKLFIAGDEVTRYSKVFPHVTFIDVKVLRKLAPLRDFWALLNLIYICLKIRPKIIHSIMPKAGLLASIAGSITFVPIRIHTYTGQVWNTMSGPSRKFYRFIDKVILQLTTICLTDSSSQSKFLQQNGISKNNEALPYLSKGSLSGVALERFDIDIVKQRNVLRAELNIGEHDFVYVFLARKSIIKGIKELFAAFAALAHLPDVKLLFIGPDESEGYLEELYLKYQHISDKVIGVDMVKMHEKYLAISDVLCLPSSSEGFGTIVIEAAALGVPSIGFEIVGLTDAIENGVSGVLVPFKDVDKFAEAMLDLYKDKSKLQQMKLNARKRILDYFSADIIYNSQKEFYNNLLNKLGR